MIEIDDTNHHDFLRDADKSGFDDDQESFRLGKFPHTSETHSEAQALETQEVENQPQTASILPDVTAHVIDTPSFDDEPLFPSRFVKTDAPSQDNAQRNETAQALSSQNTSAFTSEPLSETDMDDDGPSFEEISQELAVAFPQHTDTTAPSELLVEPDSDPEPTSQFSPQDVGTYEEDSDGQEHIPQQEIILDRDALLEKRYQDQLRQEQEHAEAYLRGDLTDTHPEPQEIASPEAQVQNSGAPQLSPPLNAQEHSEGYSSEYSSKQSGTEEAYLHGMDNASSLPPLKVITIPDADEQRRRDAEYAAAQKAKQSQNRANTRLRDLVSASIFSLILAAVVAFGYMALRKTSLGKSISTAWAKISGQAPSALQDTSLTPLDLTQNPAQRNLLGNSSDNPTTGLTTSSGDSTTTSNSAQTAPPTPVSTEKTSDSKTETTTTLPPVPDAPASAQNTAKNDIQGQSSQPAQNVAVNTSKPQLKEQQPAQNKEQPKESKQKEEKKKEEQQKKTEQPIKADVQKNNSAQAPVETKAQTAKQLPTNQTTKQNRSTAIEQQSAQQISGVFAIQVYATPSLADAEDWLERLKQRRMMNPIITSQVIRGQTIYRVRFGLYNSLQEAERDAARQGYTGSWVVRLR